MKTYVPWLIFLKAAAEWASNHCGNDTNIYGHTKPHQCMIKTFRGEGWWIGGVAVKDALSMLVGWGVINKNTLNRGWVKAKVSVGGLKVSPPAPLPGKF